ncbi:HNH endonuclease [Persicitalea sp.]|uniref:HNH endonuclease n=1 Tax=Persicitalea sp. TaxID=3100273 RepID=UPI003593BB12
MERSSRYIPDALRLEVAVRADYRCEYCLRPEKASFLKFQIDHIISRKHGGLTISENLAYTCPVCNNSKGSDVGTVLEDEETFVRLYNPRKYKWQDHFEINEGAILAKSDIGSATIKILNLNDVNRILERLDLIEAGILP